MSANTHAADLEGHVATHLIPPNVIQDGLHQEVPECPCDPEVVDGITVGDRIYVHRKYDPGTRQEHDRALDERRDVMVTL